MKNRYIYIFMMALFAVFACERVEELSQPEKEQETVVEKVEMTFNAVIESEDTKTVIVDSDVENVKKVFWQEGDAIAISNEAPLATGGYYDEWSGQWNYSSVPVEKFMSKATSPVHETEFEGKVEFARNYKAFYPYSETVADSSNVFFFDMPAVQRYVNGSFDPQSAPMVATAQYGETFKFKNVYGVLALNLVGTDAVQSITFSANNEYGSPAVLAGRFKVNPADAEPSMTLHKSPGYSVKLDCGEPAQLDPVTPTPFYIILPPGTYQSFMIKIDTPEGKKMLKSGKNPLNIQRSHIKPTGDLEYVETVTVDLSERGNANCYIVPSEGFYSFDANIIGNGEYGYVSGEKFYPAEPSINPYSVSLLWEEKSGMVSDLELEDGKVTFMSDGQKGNAFVAVKNAYDEILWSWHLWMTDQPQDHLYENSKGTFTVLDRNIGAIRADRGTGEEWKESVGTLYQWGRKDPFRHEIDPQQQNTQVYLEEVVLYPTTYFYGNSNWFKDEDRSDYLWSPMKKTIYDPCPVGYRVAVQDIWAGFTKDGENADRKIKINANGSFDYGFNFYYDNNQNVAWYPVNNYLATWGGINWNTSDAHFWSANNYGWYDSYRFYFSYNSDMECSVQIKDCTDYHGYAFSVRCMKDENHVDLSYPRVKMVKILDSHSTGATVVADVYDEGAAEVTERGFLWGVRSDLTLENTPAQQVGSGGGEFSYAITGLQNATQYYVRAYAKNERGLSYSDPMPFITPWEGSAYNLSRNGTANSYIVPAVYSEYSFNASVKGNSNEPVGQISEVEVLWETELDGYMKENENYSISVGDIITEAYLEGNMIHFMLPFTPKQGNALIAVKDAAGTILWSWHIWVVDFDPVKTQVTFPSGAILMDRNIGALSATSGTFDSYGLYYQWGRKDPFVHPYLYTAPYGAIRSEYYDSYNDTIERATANPCVVYDDAKWNYVENLWGTSKTMYDPCPYGWKVADDTAVEYGTWTPRNSYFEVQTSTPYAYFPYTGSIEAHGMVYGWGSIAEMWTIKRGYYHAFHYGNSANSSETDVEYQMPVRCMKDQKTPVSGGGNDYVGDDDYEWND